MRRGSIVQLVVIGIVSGAIATCIAVLVPWMPVTASRQAERIEFTYWFATVISLFVFAVVAAILIYSLINFRVKDPNDWSDGPPIHGHTAIEVVWTIIPTILVTAICIVSAVVLTQNSNAGNAPLKVNVVAQQFAWSFSYDGGKTYYPIMRLPIDRKVKLHAARERRDPLLLGAAVRAEAGRRARHRPEPRDHAEQDRLLARDLHRAVRSRPLAHAQPGDRDVAGRLRRLAQEAVRAAGGGGGGAASGEATFIGKGCGACHTFSAIPSAQGKVGPVARQPQRGRGGRRQAARGLHPRVDRRPERLPREGVQPAEHDAVVRDADPPGQTSMPLCSIWPRTRSEPD